MSTPFQIIIDCQDADRMADFWSAALGYLDQPVPTGFSTWEEFFEANGMTAPADGAMRVIVDPDEVGPAIKFVTTPAEDAIGRASSFELRPGDDDAKHELVNNCVAAGATVINTVREPYGWWTILSDPEGHEFCVL